MKIKLALGLFTLYAFAPNGVASAKTPQYIPYTTTKISQISGDWDIGWRVPTQTQTGSQYQVYFTDLGSSFEHNGQLAFLFGDTLSGHTDLDSPDFLAFTNATNAHSIELEFIKEGDHNRALPIDIPGITERDLEVPSYGVSIDGDIYIAFTTESDGLEHPDGDQMRKSYLCRSKDDGKSWERLYLLSGAKNGDFSDAHFINVAFAKSQNTAASTPFKNASELLYIWGTGEYRKSAPYLAVVESNSISNPQAMRYFKGLDPTGSPQWSKHEADAQALFDSANIGEFSAIHIREINQWAIAYFSDSLDPKKRGTYVRFADTPWGPYSHAQKIFDPWRDRGFTEFMHVNSQFGLQDNVMDPGSDFTWGGEYAPYLIERFTEYSNNKLNLYFTMSTWNPYQVVLMRSSFTLDHLPPKPKPFYQITMPGGADWKSLSPDVWFTPRLLDESLSITTEADKGIADVGAMWRTIPDDPEIQRIEFEIWGGDIEAILIEGSKAFPSHVHDIPAFYHQIKHGEYGRIVRVATGLRDHEARRKVLWGLQRHERKDLRLLIIDPWHHGWGSGSISSITFTNSSADRFSKHQAFFSEDTQTKACSPFEFERIKFSNKNWKTSEDADRFFVEERYGKRFVSSLTEKGFEANGTLIYKLNGWPEESFFAFNLVGQEASVALVDADLFSEEDCLNAHLAPTAFAPRANGVIHHETPRGATMPGHRIVWPIPAGDSEYYFVITDSKEPKTERFLSVSEPTRYTSGSGKTQSTYISTELIQQRRLAVGAYDWGFSAEPFFRSFYQGNMGWLTTFAENGDDDTGYMWKGFPAMRDLTQISFQIAGSGGTVYLLDGEFPAIPNDLAAEQLKAGIEAEIFGPVLYSESGHESTTSKQVDWNVSKKLIHGGRILIIDDSAGAWGFTTVYDFILK